MARSKYFFLGVSTKSSLVNKTFPIWMDVFSQKIDLETFDLQLRSGPEMYVSFIDGIQRPCVGSLITSHKTDIFETCSHLFNDISEDAVALREISAVRRDQYGNLFGHNTDIAGSSRSLRRLTLENESWLSGNRNIIILGAGGACLSLIKSIRENIGCANKVLITEKRPDRLETVREIAERNAFEVGLKDASYVSDAINESGKNPLIINATGMGKDIPGSPIPNPDDVPGDATFWELNYRGELDLFRRLKAASKGIMVADGWDFFVDGWMNNILFVLNISLSDEEIRTFRRVSAEFQPS